MTQRPSPFIWYELVTTDMDAAVTFYGAVTGWESHPLPTPDGVYSAWSAAGTMIGGMTVIGPVSAAKGMRPQWLGYLGVDDADAAVAAVEAAGGSLRMPAADIPGAGRIAMVTDPQGAAFYVMRPSGEGPSEAFAPGRPGHGGWHELHTPDPEAALAFYAGHFGWTPAHAMDMGPMGLYRMFKVGEGDAVGGMMANPAVPTPMWLIYFNVTGIEAAKSRVETAGGAVLHGPMEVPGGLWVVQARDPQGAMFALVGPQRD